MREQIADLALFERHLDDLFHALPIAAAPDGWTQTFDLQPFLERFTMDTATEFLFGESVYSLRDDNAETSALVSKAEMNQFVQDFFATEKTTAESMIFGDLYWLVQGRTFRGQCKAVHGFVDTYVSRRLRSGSEKKAFPEKYVVLDALVADMQDPKELRSQLLNILLAGSDTISATLGFVVASLAQHPDVLLKLRNVILDEFGTRHHPKEITLSRLRNCSYLQWFLNEVLRMYPAVPINFREAVRDTTLPFGGGPHGDKPVFIPKGCMVEWEVSCHGSRQLSMLPYQALADGIL
jgi:cytochrome P450